MKTKIASRLLSTMILLGLCNAYADSQHKTVRLFILSGQSNAAGNANGDQLSAEQLQTDPDVIIYSSEGDWHPLAPEKLTKPKKKFGIENSSFGVEMSFAKALKKAYPDDIIAVCKVGIRGTTSIVAWEKNRDRPGWLEELTKLDNEASVKRNLYQELIDGTQSGIELLKKRPDVGNIQICGMLWCQNERDSSQIEFCQTYKSNLINLIQNIRQDLNRPDLPFLFFDEHLKKADPTGPDLLKKGLREVVVETPQTALVENNDLPTYEGIHFTTEGMWILGERFAESYFKLIKDTKQ